MQDQAGTTRGAERDSSSAQFPPDHREAMGCVGMGYPEEHAGAALHEQHTSRDAGGHGLRRVQGRVSGRRLEVLTTVWEAREESGSRIGSALSTSCTEKQFFLIRPMCTIDPA